MHILLHTCPRGKALDTTSPCLQGRSGKGCQILLPMDFLGALATRQKVVTGPAAALSAALGGLRAVHNSTAAFSVL